MPYWRDRVFNQQKVLLGKSIDELENELARLYKSALQENKKDLEGLYLDLMRQDIKGEVKINDLYRYNRYWEVRADLNKKLTSLGVKQNELMGKSFYDMYYRVQDYFNKNPKFLAKTVDGKVVKMVSTIPVDTTSPIVAEKAQAVVNSVWCADGKYWSERVWGRMDKLQASLEKGLTDIIVRGASPDELSRSIAQEFNKDFNTARTLVRTELSHIYNQAAAERYQEAGCEWYEVLSNQSEDECYEMNGTVIRFSEMVEGENCPPFHPNCRCAILPVIGGKNG